MKIIMVIISLVTITLLICNSAYAHGSVYPVVNAYYIELDYGYKILYEVDNKSTEDIRYTIYGLTISAKNIIYISEVTTPEGWYIYRPETHRTIVWRVTDQENGIGEGQSLGGFSHIYRSDAIHDIAWEVIITLPGQGFGGFNGTVTPVPEPASLLILSAGLAGFAGAVRRRRKT